MVPYDIGSGPEMSCSRCEWCWGADGQPLNPKDATDWVPRWNLMSEPPWDKDIEQILERHEHPSRHHVEPAWFHTVLREAWQHGYTTGMADAAKTWNPMKQSFE